MRQLRWIIGCGFLVSISACAILGDFSSDVPKVAERPGQFEGQFLALSDSDMAGTAYADGKLEPLLDTTDTLTLFAQGQAFSSRPAPNSVISWPAVLDVSPDGRFAYVVETRGAASSGVEQMDSVYEDFPEGHSLTVFSITADGLGVLETVNNLTLNPQSVEASPDGRFLVIGSEQTGEELVILPLDEEGQPLQPIRIDLDPPYKPDDAEKRIRSQHISPDGTLLAANVGNRRIQFYRLIYSGSAVPHAVEAMGAPVDVGVRLAVGKWTPDSRFFVVTDVNSYESSLAMLTQKGGQVHVISAPSESMSAKHIDSARVGRFAEGVEISDDGTRIASIAMGRTYLPNLPFLEFWPKRRTYSLTLLSIEPTTGELDILDEARLAGVLPEDVIFDKTGQNLAVATFHRRKGPDRQRGFIDFFEITQDGQLMSQGVTQPVIRGPHDLVRIP